MCSFHSRLFIYATILASTAVLWSRKQIRFFNTTYPHYAVAIRQQTKTPVKIQNSFQIHLKQVHTISIGEVKSFLNNS